MKKYQFFVLFCIAIFISSCTPTQHTTQTSQNQSQTLAGEEVITLDDIWSSGKFSASGVWGMNALKDGQSFSKIENDFSPSVVSYSFKTGDKLKTIFDGKKHKLSFSSYTFSDDESKLLLATESEPIYRRSSKGQYYVYDTKTDQLTKLVENGKKQSFPTFSPDASKIAYVQANNLYVKDLSSGKTTAITTNGQWNKIINGQSDWVYEEEFMITKAFEWSPDGQKIAYFSFDESAVKQFNMDFYGDLYPELYEFKYPKAGEKNSVVSTFVYNVANQQTTEINTGKNQDVYFPRMKWTPSNELVLFKMNRHQNELELLKANDQTGATSVLLKETNPYYISEDVLDEMEFLPNGDFLWTSERSGYKHVYLYDSKGQLKQQITNGDFDVTALYGFDKANNTIFYQAAAESPLQREIYSAKLDGSGASLLTPQKGTNSANFTDSFDYFIHTFSSATQPNVITVRNRKGEEVRVLEDNAQLKNRWDNLNLPKTEFTTIETTNGVQLNASVLKPTNFNAKNKYPVLMFVYGGPGSQTVTDSWAASNYWWHSYLTQKGYIVVSVDNRGTGARGQEFKKMTYKELGKYEVEDQIAAAKYLGNLPYVDANRIGIWGWSYGGYMSSLALFKGNDVFKTAISVAPVTNWRYYDTIYTERYMRTPQENASGYDENSPINHVDKLKGNFMLVHGMADDNVHFQNSVDLISALNAAGKQYELAIYPNKNHGIYGGNTRRHLYEKMTNFILENL